MAREYKDQKKLNGHMSADQEKRGQRSTEVQTVAQESCAKQTQSTQKNKLKA